MYSTEPVEWLRRVHCTSSVGYLKEKRDGSEVYGGSDTSFHGGDGISPRVGSGPIPFLAVTTGCGTVDYCGCTICICSKNKEQESKEVGYS